MEKRLIAQGPKNRQSYTVTLPLEWIKQQGLDKTKLVDLEIVGSKAIINITKEEQETKFIDGDKAENALMKILQSAYRLGINELNIKYSKPGIRKYVTDIVDTKLIGYEIIEHSKGRLKIKDITKESSEEFKIVLRRIFLLLIEMAGSPKEVDESDKNLKKLTNYCQRLLIKKGHLNHKKVPFYYMLLDQIEKLSDEYVWLYSSKVKNHNILKQLNRYLNETYEIFYKFNLEKFNKTQHDTFLLKRKLTGKGNIHMHNIARQLNTILGTVLIINFENV
ncbi:MAG: hypothetical protein KKA79_02090 [Nanoarchaeota archaeon]|nr:hypothetical protein [Nanoarchaeota archaeon]MCG2717381.1 hypothetical protein [Nanoarchaeota archaeon]